MVSRMKAILIVLTILIIVTIVTGSESSTTRDAEIDQLLKKLNKPALKSIKSHDGDIIDCVHMKNHPIYDHPLFKNHTIQMRPSSYPKEWNNVSSNTRKQSNIVTQLWTMNGRCPKTVFRLEEQQEKTFYEQNRSKYTGKKYPNNIFQHQQRNAIYKHEYAIIRTNVGKFDGGRADINVWKPYVQTAREFILAQIWLVANAPNVNTIEAGWQIYAKKYGDYRPRFFVYWIANGYNKSGCYNLECPSFLPVNPEFVVGAAIKDISTMGGEQHEMHVSIWKDSRSGHWWLKAYDKDVGYWPAKLFNILKDSATEVNWRGEIINYTDGSQHTTTKMGSGRFAERGYRNASYFKYVQTHRPDKNPQEVLLSASVTDMSCYNLILGSGHSCGAFFYYGGPGRNCYCT